MEAVANQRQREQTVTTVQDKVQDARNIRDAKLPLDILLCEYESCTTTNCNIEGAPVFPVVGSGSRQRRKQCCTPIFMEHTFDCCCVSGSTPCRHFNRVPDGLHLQYDVIVQYCDDKIQYNDVTVNRYENLMFDKDAKTVKWKSESIFNKWFWQNWMATCRRLQIDPYLSPCTKLKSKWIKDLNINPVTLNLIEEKVGSTLERIGTGDHFLNITPTAQTLSATINQWDYMKLRSFCKAKDTITKTKRQPTEWEKIFTNPTSDRGLISRIYKELKIHNIKTSNSPIEKWAIELNREFMAEEYRMAKDI
ncbi:hypothetical protein STEG23_008314 [Scotinomys teguina]